MKSRDIKPTVVEKLMREEDFIVSKTDVKGRITYCNRIFIEFSGYSENQLLGSQHNIIRHPGMPRGLFKFLWDSIQAGQECNAYVKNMSQDGGFYWTFANVTPDFGPKGELQGYTSVRRKPTTTAIGMIAEIYRHMLEIERQSGAKDACSASMKYLTDLLAEKKLSYSEFILSF